MSLVNRIDAATPPDRDRAIDALRGLAILGVVLGHWLVTAITVDSGTVHNASPLGYLPRLAPVSWLLQTLAVFFFVGGLLSVRSYASACARGATYLEWFTARTRRLFLPVLVLLLVWTVLATALLLGGAGVPTVRALVKLVLSPLWFLLVFTGLTAATPLVGRLHPVWPALVVALVDVVRFGLGGPAELGWVNVAAGWLVPFCLGAAWARGKLRSRKAGWTLLLGGAAATAALVWLAGYPTTMVGVPGAPVSNLNPPTLVAVTFGLAQCGGALLLLGPLRRALTRPRAWAAVALLNLSAMTVFLWHQTAMLAVTAAGLLARRPLPGLHTPPDSVPWVLARLAWLPVFGVALLMCRAAFHRWERGSEVSPTRAARGPRAGAVVAQTSEALAGPASPPAAPR
ncbi:acyltransferase family protein [Flindersiella endophytica]